MSGEKSLGLLDLPDSCLIEIMERLPLEFFPTLCLTCKKFRSLSAPDSSVWRGLTLQYCEVDVTKKPNNVSWKAFFVDNLVFYSLILFTEYKSSKDRDRNMEDVRKNLTGKNMKVELYDATESIPDDKFLNQFDTIVLISFNSFFNEQNLLGDRVAAFIERGGGVVISCFACCGCSLHGKMAKAEYNPILPTQSSRIRPNAVSYTPKDESHPILRNVKSIYGAKDMVYSPGSVTADSKVIAEWTFDGGKTIPLLAEKKVNNARVVTINMLLSAVHESGFDPICDMDILARQAMRYVKRDRRDRNKTVPIISAPQKK